MSHGSWSMSHVEWRNDDVIIYYQIKNSDNFVPLPDDLMDCCFLTRSGRFSFLIKSNSVDVSPGRRDNCDRAWESPLLYTYFTFVMPKFQPEMVHRKLPLNTVPDNTDQRSKWFSSRMFGCSRITIQVFVLSIFVSFPVFKH